MNKRNRIARELMKIAKSITAATTVGKPRACVNDYGRGTGSISFEQFADVHEYAAQFIGEILALQKSFQEKVKKTIDDIDASGMYIDPAIDPIDSTTIETGIGTYMEKGMLISTSVEITQDFSMPDAIRILKNNGFEII